MPQFFIYREGAQFLVGNADREYVGCFNEADLIALLSEQQLHPGAAAEIWGGEEIPTLNIKL